MDLSSFVALLDREGELLVINEEVDPHLELAEIHRRAFAEFGKALLFKNVKGSRFPVVTNLFGSEKRLELALPTKPERFIERLVALATRDFPPPITALWKRRHDLRRLFRLGTKQVQRAPVTECTMAPADLEALPLLKCWPEDGGHFITLPLVYTESFDHTPPNLGMYRIQRFSKDCCGLHMQIGKGGGFHYAQAEARAQSLPVTIFLGGPPALTLAAVSPLPENVPELVFASLLEGGKIPVTRQGDHPHPLIATCDFALLGYSRPFERRLEGPFGDHYGYYSLAHDFPYVHLTAICHRKNAIFPATVVGKPPQEDLFIGNCLQKLFSPLFPVLMPQVRDLHSFGETGFHPLTAVRTQERYEREALSCAFRVLGEGQLSLSKFLIMTDQPIDIRNIKVLLECVVCRMRPECDLYIFANTAHDTLDYTGPRLNHGSKAALFGMGAARRTLPRKMIMPLPAPLKRASVFCPGCLVVDGLPYHPDTDLTLLAKNRAFADWPLVILVDDAETTTESAEAFLWNVFTRCNPASDIYASHTAIRQHHLGYTFPILIDSRMKPSYPKELIVDDQTKQRVDERWGSYFPGR